MRTSQSLLTQSTANEGGDWCKGEIGRANLLRFFAALLAVSFLLRIFYSGHLYQDDGFWFTAGEEVLRGKALYREVYFDKPPALPLVYALAFWTFGAHIIVIRLFTIFYVVAVSAVLYCFGSRLYDRRAGMAAAALFTVLSTTSVNSHEHGLNTDMLMILPYSAGAYMFVRACLERRAALALIGGILTGLAVQANPKAAFGMVFFAILYVVSRKWQREGQGSEEDRTQETQRKHDSRLRGASLPLSAMLGLLAGALPFLIYLLATRSFSDYWRFVWDWGSKYSGYLSTWQMAGRGLWLTATFFLRNNTLLFGFAFVVLVVIRSIIERPDRRTGIAAQDAALGGGVISRVLRSDITLLIWFLVSYAAIAVGGRFYSNYFIQILPSLCLIGARGLIGIHTTLRASNRNLHRVAILLIAAGFMTTLIQAHARTLVFAVDWLRGTRSAANSTWYHERLNREERMVAAAVRDLSDPDATGPFNTEAMRADSPRVRGASVGSDYLFIWGSRDEIYYWSGLLPASRYLSTQPLTGVPADVHHDGQSRPILDESVTAAARTQLLVDLEKTRPKYILDELGFFSAKLSMQSYPELQEFLRDYKDDGALGTFIIYRKKERRKTRAQYSLREGLIEFRLGWK